MLYMSYKSLGAVLASNATVFEAYISNGANESIVGGSIPPGDTKAKPLKFQQLQGFLLYKENPALDAGFKRRYAFDQNSSN